MKLAVLCALLAAAAHAQCPIHTVMVRGRVENPAPNSRIRAQLSYPKQHPGESAEATLEDGSFRLPIEFLTQSSKPFLKNLKPKCDRKPSEVVITLLIGDTAKNQITLSFPRDFVMTDASAYTPNSEIVLKSVE
jgi:hypothetical protein